MLITYIIYFAIGLLFKVLHWPGAGLLILSSIIFPFIGIIVSLFKIRKNGVTNVLKYVSVFLIALVLTFKFLYWPGGFLFYILSFLGFIAYLLVAIKKQKIRSIGFYLTGLLLAFTIFNFSLSSSSFRLAYMLEDPFNEKEDVPHFVIQSLAYNFYNEGEYTKAEKLIQRNIRHLNMLLNIQDDSPFYKQIDEENLAISLQDLEGIRTKSWNTFTPLIPEDRTPFTK